MIEIFHGADKKTHDAFQNWRKKNLDGYNLTEKTKGKFVLHYSRDLREHPDQRGCNHQGGYTIKFGEDKGSCITTARKVGSLNFYELLSWANKNGFTVRACKNCNSKRFPFPAMEDAVDHHGEIQETLGEKVFRLPEEVLEGASFFEGAVQQITVNRYERDPKAREECKKHFGTTCVLCGFDFGVFYGETMEGYIHVHHIRPLATLGSKQQIVPAKDLRPVCPNCHAVIHSREPAYSMEEMKTLMKSKRKKRK